MNSWSMVSLEDVAATPWLNGGGVTRELLAWPHPMDWTVRFSVAQVERDGPFSNLPGVRRWFAVIAGAGVQLRIDGAVHELTARSEPLAFDGGARADCKLLAGPTRDFNLMLRQGRASMQRVCSDNRANGENSANTVFDANPGAHVLCAVYALEAGATLDGGGEALRLAAGTFAWRILERETPLRLAGEALWMEIAP
jgi:uncharacterized protein